MNQIDKNEGLAQHIKFQIFKNILAFKFHGLSEFNAKFFMLTIQDIIYS